MSTNFITIPTMREKLLDAIIEMASDEFETMDDVLALAKKSDEELVDVVIGIARYYKEENNLS
jgi:hypothetical protein